MHLNDYKGIPCRIGVDLSSVSDMTAISAMIPYEGKFIFKSWIFLPESTLEESVNKELYKYWKSTGDIIITDGNVISYDAVLQKMNEINAICPIEEVLYDPYNSTSWAISSTNEGYNMTQYNQNLAHFNRPTKQLEILIRTDKAIIDDNRAVKWCFNNVVLRRDYNENCKPDKTTNENKIDPIISMVEALGGWLDAGGDMGGYNITII